MDRAGRRRGDPDRFEIEQVDFFQRVRETYLRLAETHPERFAVVDATQSLDDVKENVGRIAAALLEQD